MRITHNFVYALEREQILNDYWVGDDDIKDTYLHALQCCLSVMAMSISAKWMNASSGWRKPPSPHKHPERNGYE